MLTGVQETCPLSCPGSRHCPAICTFCYLNCNLQGMSQNTSLWLGLLMLWNCFIEFAVEHWFGCRATEPGNNNNNNNKHLYGACSTECAHRRFTVNYYYPWSIGLETIMYCHSPSAEHTSPAAYMALVELFNHTISFTARPGSTHR